MVDATIQTLTFEDASSISAMFNNAEIDAEDIYEVLVGARADGTLVSTLCSSSENSPPANTILYHLRTKFEPDRIWRRPAEAGVTSGGGRTRSS